MTIAVRRVRFPVVAFVGAAALVLAVIAFAATRESGGSGGSPGGGGGSVAETRPVSVVAGAAGMAPVVRGQAFDGSPVAIVDDGRPKLIFFVAHWCPHCRAEVPVVTKWLRAADLPEGVDLYAVSTSVNRNAVNYPPSAWLEREGWPVKTLADDAAGSTAQAYGVEGFPYFVAVAADGRVAARDSGELPVARLEALVAAARR